MSMNSKDKANSGRVRITYDVETGGVKNQKELPFVVGVIGDFGDSRTRRPLSERRFAEINNRNFDSVMGELSPTVSLAVDNVLSGKDADGEVQTGLRVNLTFKTMGDFEPESIVEQVPQLKALKDARVRLRELLTKANRSEDLADLLKEILTDSAKLSALSETLRPADEK